MMRELGIPIAIGIAAGLIVALIPAGSEPDATPAVIEEPALGVQFLWPDGPIMDAPRGSILVVADGGKPTNITWQGPAVHDESGDVRPIALTAELHWHGHVATVPITDESIQCIRAPCPQPLAPWNIRPPVDGVRFDALNDSVQLSLYAFNAEGELVASTARAATLDDFDLYADYIPLSNVWWHLGNGSAPDAERLPFGAALAAAALDGLPVGGVATLHLPEHPYAWLVGELWLTGRIDAIR